jgi:hypothetical protein
MQGTAQYGTLETGINGLNEAYQANDGFPANMAGSQFALMSRVSPRSVMLAYGSRPSTPAGWRWHDAGGIRFAAPPSWVIGVERDGWWVSCPYGVAPMAVLVRTSALRSAFGCGKLPRTGTGSSALLPAGVVVGAGPDAVTEIASGALALCWPLGDLRACALQPADNGALLRVAVFPPGTARPALVEIGLARSAVTAQEIFDSIRPAPGKELAVPRAFVPCCVGERRAATDPIR